MRWPASLVAGSGIFAVIAGCALFGPALAPFPYDEMNILARFLPPDATHWLGTDEFGRDVLSRLLYGARLSLLMGLGATLFCLLAGVPLGLAAGYYGGRIDEAIMRSSLLIRCADFDGHLILSIRRRIRGRPPLRWASSMCRSWCARARSRSRLHRRSSQRARARGERAWYILGAEILPNAWPPIIVESALRVTFAIMLGAALSFLGLGVHPPASDWGLMIAEARPFIAEAPWVAIAPGVVLCFTVIAVNLIGDGLRELLDPRLK